MGGDRCWSCLDLSLSVPDIDMRACHFETIRAHLSRGVDPDGQRAVRDEGEMEEPRLDRGRRVGRVSLPRGNHCRTYIYSPTRALCACTVYMRGEDEEYEVLTIVAAVLSSFFCPVQKTG